MDVIEVIRNLRSADKGTRILDGQIAQLLGWVRRTKPFVDQATGEMKIREQWFFRDAQEPGKVPLYTYSLQHAFDLVHELCPASRGGCSWEDGKGSARIDDGPYIQAATPQIALCIAALMASKEITATTKP